MSLYFDDVKHSLGIPRVDGPGQGFELGFWPVDRHVPALKKYRNYFHPLVSFNYYLYTS